MAPTGRAAKVMAANADKKAFTIHRIIYRKKERADGSISFGVGNNLLKSFKITYFPNQGFTPSNQQ